MKDVALDPQVCVVGGGMVGLTFALLCAEKGIATALIEARPMPEGPVELSARVSALNLGSLSLLKELKVWPLPDERHSGVFRSLNIWDGVTGADILFDSAEVGEPHLGYNVSNAALVQALWQRAQQHPNLRLLAPMKIKRLLPLENGKVTAELDNGELLQPDCLVGADGAESWLRQQAGIECDKTPYDHHAVVTVVETEKPHKEQGWQVFLPSGPLALLPLHDRYQSAVVWSMPPEQAAHLAALSDTDVAVKMNEVFGPRLGAITLKLPVKSIPLFRRHATTYSKPGIALIGDAAHTIHPLAGQGANLGLRDAAALADLMGEAFARGRHLGHERLLARYERQRRADNRLMMEAMQFFHDSFAQTAGSWTQLRKMGMRGFNRSRALKRLCMQYAMGGAD